MVVLVVVVVEVDDGLVDETEDEIEEGKNCVRKEKWQNNIYIWM